MQRAFVVGLVGVFTAGTCMGEIAAYEPALPSQDDSFVAAPGFTPTGVSVAHTPVGRWVAPTLKPRPASPLASLRFEALGHTPEIFAEPALRASQRPSITPARGEHIDDDLLASL